MSSSGIWASLGLRAEWQQAISHKIVRFFEAFIHAPRPYEFKTKHEHHEDTGIPLKFIDRRDGSLAEFLAGVGLVVLERANDGFRITPQLPVTFGPPPNVRLPLYASWERGTRRRHDRRTVYDLDAGVCAYCSHKVDFNDCVIDHIYPFERGGADAEENLTVQCKSRECRKWFYVPGDPGWRVPLRFRGRKVKTVGFAKRGDVVVPEFEFENEAQ